MATTTIITKPTDLYDPRWVEYNAQHPNVRRSVGAAGDDDRDEAAAAAAKAAEDAAKALEATAAAAKKLADEEAAKNGMDPEKAKLLKDLMKHKDAAKAEKAKATDLETKLTGLNERMKTVLGVDTLEEVEAALAKVAVDEETRAKQAGDFDKLKGRMVKEHEKALATLKAELEGKVTESSKKLDTAITQIRTLLVTNSFASSKFLSDHVLVTPLKAEKLYGEHFKVEDKDGKLSVVAYLGGEPLVDSVGVPLPFDAAFKEIIDKDPEKDSILKSKARAGSGSGTSNTAVDLTNKSAQNPGRDRIAAALKAADKKKA